MKKILMCMAMLLIISIYSFASEDDNNFVSTRYKYTDGLNVKKLYFIDLSQEIPAEKTVINDNIVFVNRCNNEGFVIQPYYLVAKTNQWVMGWNKAVLKGNGDKSTVDNLGLELSKIKCIAFSINPEDDYGFAVYGKNHDLYIEFGN